MRIAAQKPGDVRGIPLERWMARRRRRRALFFTLLAVTFASLIAIQFLRHSGRYESAIRVVGTVTAIDDGRTLVLSPEGATGTIRVRLLGITENAAPRDAAAQKWLAEQAVGKRVTVSFDRRARRYDEASRLRGYVYLSDGKMLNGQLLTHGLAAADPSENYTLRPWFIRLQGRAKPPPTASAKLAVLGAKAAPKPADPVEPPHIEEED